MPEIPSLDALELLMVRQRAVRTFTSDPVDDALIERILNAATRAPSAKNVQCLRFVVVRDRALKQQISALFEQPAAQPGGPTPWEDIPVLIFVCSENEFGTSPSGLEALFGSVYPGVQNLLLAAQAAGLGTVLTTSRGKTKEPQIKELLAIPERTEIHAVIPMGYAAVKLGKNRRRPVSEVAYRDKFGNAW